MSNRIITISREFGSGGRTIGRKLAEKLGIPCYDQEIIEKIAVESGLAKEYIAESSEYTSYGGWLSGAFVPRDMNGHSLQDDLWIIQNEIIKKLADEGPCVIVGRCADYILRGEADLLRVFIHADMEKRAERIVAVYGENANSPEKRLKDKDKRRAAYYNYYTDCKWGDKGNYDLILNSSTLGIDKCVDILSKIY